MPGTQGIVFRHVVFYSLSRDDVDRSMSQKAVLSVLGSVL